MAIVPSEGPSPFDALRDSDDRWSARKVANLMGYTRWENLAPALKRAMASARNEGLDVDEVFLRSQENPSGLGGRPREDFRMTRHGAYLLAMNGDPNKPQVAAAQTYFARKTREAETQPAAARLPDLATPEGVLALATQFQRTAEQLVEADRKLKELEPSAQAWDVLASAEGDYSLRDAAFILNRDSAISTGQNRLLRTIREFGMVDRNNVPYAKHAAHLVERPTSYEHPRTKETVLSKQLRVTVQGLRYLHRRMGGAGPLQLPRDPAA
ncbi:phage antirepressor KilAC domain-containing protein [Streptomyces venezuelae]|uniref:phage antirepressor KilAC domain-containing protein n=1 Tax=Streptomyces venezuelae TaxID=54571 RepID=UPI00342D8644